MEFNELLGWVILGLIAGVIAQRVLPGEERTGCFLTIGLGIIGAVVGGWIGRHVGFLPQPTSTGLHVPSFPSILTATVGAMVILGLWKWLRA